MSNFSRSVQDACIIARRDFLAFFTQPIAYIVLAVFLGINCFFFIKFLDFFLQAVQQVIQQGPKPTISERILEPLFGNMCVIFLFLIPSITMRSFAEERKDRSDALLFSAPISVGAIIFGKFFAAMAFLSVMIFSTLPFVLVLYLTSTVDWGVVFSCYLGVYFLAGSAVTVGLFWSAITENQIVAATMTFGSLMFLWLLSWSSYSAGPVWGEVLGYISIISHFQTFANGVIDTSDILYYVLLSIVSLFATFSVFDANQWS